MATNLGGEEFKNVTLLSKSQRVFSCPETPQESAGPTAVGGVSFFSPPGVRTMRRLARDAVIGQRPTTYVVYGKQHIRYKWVSLPPANLLYPGAGNSAVFR